MSSQPSKVVGLFVRADLSSKRELLRSLAHEARIRGHWELLLLAPVNRGVGFNIPPKMDGLIMWPDEPGEVEPLLQTKVPAITMGHVELTKDVPRIVFDNVKMGCIIAEAFLECGFRHFAAFCQRLPYLYAQDRLEGFRSRIAETGLHFTSLLDAGTMSLEPSKWQEGLTEFGEWINNLPKPVGILCDTDQAGADLLRACQHFGIRVPDTVAVIAVGNDDLLCNLSHPPLSSVSLFGSEIGRLAVGMLEERMRFPKRAAETVVMENFKLISRASSDFLAVGDAAVVKALRTIRERATLGIGVDQVAGAAALSRRSLEGRFKAATGRTVYEEILRVKLSRAQSLLAATELSVAEVADRTGFGEPQRLCEVFAKKIGMTPLQWRRQAR